MFDRSMNVSCIEFDWTLNEKFCRRYKKRKKKTNRERREEMIHSGHKCVSDLMRSIEPSSLLSLFMCAFLFRHLSSSASHSSLLLFFSFLPERRRSTRFSSKRFFVENVSSSIRFLLSAFLDGNWRRWRR